MRQSNIFSYRFDATLEACNVWWHIGPVSRFVLERIVFNYQFAPTYLVTWIFRSIVRITVSALET